jgi:hypothetical protein
MPSVWIEDVSAVVTQPALDELAGLVVSGRVEQWIAAHSGQLETVVVAWFAVTPNVVRELGTSRAAAAFGADARRAVGFEIRHGRPAGILRLLAMDAPPDLRDANVGTAVFTEIEGTLAAAMVLDRVAAVVDVRARVIAERAIFDERLPGRRDDSVRVAPGERKRDRR